MAIVSSLTAIQADNNEYSNYYELAYLIALNNVKKEDKQPL